MTAVSSLPAAAADSAAGAGATAAAAQPKDPLPAGVLGAFVKLLNGLLEQGSGETDAAPQDERGRGEDSLAAMTALVAAPVPVPAALPEFAGSAFLPTAAGASVPSTEPEHATTADSSPGETASWFPPAGSFACQAGVSGDAVDPVSGRGFAPAEPAFSEAAPASAIPAEAPGEEGAQAAAAMPDPKTSAAPEAPASVRAPAAAPAIAPSGGPPNTAPNRAPHPIPADAPAAVAVWNAAPAAGEHAPTSTLAFGYRLTPAAPRAGAGAPVAAGSGAAPFNPEPAPPDPHPAASQANHPAVHQRIAPEVPGTREAAAPEVRMTSGMAPVGNIPEAPMRSSESAGPGTRPAGGAPPTPSEPLAPAAPPASAHEIRLQVAGKSQRVDVRVTERAGEVQLAVRTPDARLAGWLREDLGALSARLEQAGFRAEVWQPGAWTAEHRAAPAEMRAAGAAPGEELNRQNDSQQQQSDPQRRPHAREAGAREPAAEFSGVLESLD